MSRYVIKRLLLIIPIIIGISFVIFTIMALTPGDPASLILSAGATQDDIDALNHELGYDRPFMVRCASARAPHGLILVWNTGSFSSRAAAISFCRTALRLNMVSSTPMISSSGLQYFFTALIVCMSWVIPCKEK